MYVKKRRYTKRNTGVFLVTLFLVFTGLYFSARIVAGHTINSKPVSEDVLEESVYVPAVIFANGQNVVSPAGGKIEYLVDDNTRVPVGKEIARVKSFAADNSGDKPIFTIESQTAGLVDLSNLSLSLPLNRDLVSQMSLDKLYSLVSQTKNTDTTVANGQTVVRIINNLEPAVVVLQLNPDFFPTLKTGQKLEIVSKDIAKVATVLRLEKQEDGSRLVSIEVPSTFVRGELKTNLIVKGRSYHGFILPQEALKSTLDGPGVYVIREGAPLWQPVEIMGEIGDRVAVQGLSEKEEVVQNAAAIDNKK